MEKKNVKKELKVVFSEDIYDELKYVFRPDQLENIIYKPAVTGEHSWMCSCGFETEFDMCPICGMEKNTVLSKVNAAYLSRHRKARLSSNKSKSAHAQKDAISSMVHSNDKNKVKARRKTTLIAFLILLIAAIVCTLILFVFNREPSDPSGVKQTETTVTKETDTPETKDSSETQAETEAPSHTDEVTTSDEQGKKEPEDKDVIKIVPEGVYEIEDTSEEIATMQKDKYPAGVSGNSNMGGKIFVGEKFDYAVQNGINILDKDGKISGKLTSENASFIDGSKDYIFMIGDESKVTRIALADEKAVPFDITAKKLAVGFDQLFYFDGTALYKCDFDGKQAKKVFDGTIYALTFEAGKLYFSTDTSLCALTDINGTVKSFCKDGAKATAVREMDTYVFYTNENGDMHAYYPSRLPLRDYIKVYPLMTGEKFTYMVASGDKLFYRTESAAGTVWYETNTLFQYNKKLEVTSSELYVTDSYILDGELNIITLS